MELGEANVILEHHLSYRTGDKGFGRKKDCLPKLKVFVILCSPKDHTGISLN